VSDASINDRFAGPVIVCYDGSQAADEALMAAAALLRGAPAIVLTVWRPILETILAVSLGPAPTIGDPAEADERQSRAAIDVARAGARLASDAGLQAEPLAIRANGPIWEAIEKTADEREARLIVCGSGRSGLMSAVFDSVPAALVYRSARPVLAVPSREAAEQRRRELVSWTEIAAQRRRELLDRLAGAGSPRRAFK
jgi:nucleotide-binding universal stress UspA family protein